MLAIKIIITISQTVCLLVLSISQSPCLHETNLAPSVSLGVSPSSISLPPAIHSCLPLRPSLDRLGLSPGLCFGLASFSCGVGDSVWPPGQWDRQVGFPTRCPPSCPGPNAVASTPSGQATCQLQLLAWAGDTGLAACPQTQRLLESPLSLGWGRGALQTRARWEGAVKGHRDPSKTGMSPAPSSPMPLLCWTPPVSFIAASLSPLSISFSVARYSAAYPYP